nr:TVP38/TMEM64 family protein [Trabulsiella guamensis]
MPRSLLSLNALQHSHAALAEGLSRHPLAGVALYFLLYVLVSALSIPGAALLTLLGGSLFPFWLALIVVSFASTAGATLAMLASRYLLADGVTQRFPGQMNTINAGMARDGAFYLFALRLMPLFPFFLVNLLTGVTRIGVARYWWVSQLGMLPATVVYVNAGRQLGQLNTLQDILSPAMLLAFALIGLLPLISRKLMARFIQQ